jgi:hypothetical protein
MTQDAAGRIARIRGLMVEGPWSYDIQNHSVEWLIAIAIYANPQYAECAMCEASAWGDWQRTVATVPHANDCPWLRLQMTLTGLPDLGLSLSG